MSGSIFLVTGGAGFVGSTIAIKLKTHRDNIHVIALDNLKRRGAELNLPRLKKHGVEFIHGDIRNPEDLIRIEKVHHVIECSAEPSVMASYSSPPHYMINTNLMGTVNCLELARKHRAEVVFLSTSRVYPIRLINAIPYCETDMRFEISGQDLPPGVSPNGICEEFPLLESRSLYGATKLCAELLILEYMDLYGITAVINRCGLIAGPWQMGKIDQGVVALWAAAHVYKQPLDYIGFKGEGKQVRDVLHVDDLFTLITKQLERSSPPDQAIFNVGGGPANSMSLKEMTLLCREYTDNKIDIGKKPESRKGDIRIYISDYRLAADRFDWAPEKNCRETVRETCDWIRRHKELLRPVFTRGNS